MKECNIVKDLIPLYDEELLSQESKEFVEKHIKDCEECKTYLSESLVESKISENDDTKTQLESMKKSINKRIRTLGFSVAFLLLAVFALVANYLTAPIYFEYSEDWFEKEKVGDNLNLIATNTDITNFNVAEYKDEIMVEAYTTRWEMITRFGAIVEKSIQIPNNKAIYYSNKYDNAKALNTVENQGGIKELPRLALNMYFMVALSIVAVMVILYTFMRLFKINTGKFKYWLALIFIPASYLIGFLLVKGPDGGASFDMMRDLQYILISGVASMAFITSIYSLIKNRI